jgi:hypothetical protein
MSFKRTIVIAVVFLLVGGFYYFYEFRGKPVREELKRKESAVFSLEEEKISMVTFLRQNVEGITNINGREKFTFEKTGESWFIKEPVESRADKDTLESFVKTIATSQKDEIIDKSAKDLDKYGLDNPRYELIISDGSKEEILLIGDNTIDDRSFYAKLKNEPTVYLISTNLKFNLDKRTDDYRDRTIVDIPREEINKVVYHRNKDTFVFEKAGENWTTTHELIPRPGTDEISTFVHYLTNLRVKAFLPNDTNTQKKLGIENSSFWMEIYGKDVDKPVLLRIGKSDENTGNLYVSVVGANDIFGIPLLEIEKLKKYPSDFIDRKLLKVDTADIAKFEVRIDNKPYIFEKEDTTTDKKNAETTHIWKLTSPVTKTLEKSQSDNVLSSLTNMFVKEAFISDKDMSEFGLGKPMFYARGQRDDTKVLFEVTFGKESVEPGNQDTVYAKIKGENSILLINKSSIEQLKELVTEITGVKPEQKSPETPSERKTD